MTKFVRKAWRRGLTFFKEKLQCNDINNTNECTNIKIHARQIDFREFYAQPRVPTRQMNTNTWFYCDGDGQFQGPYDADQMILWTKTGYFAPGLVVKSFYSNTLVALIDVPAFASALPVEYSKHTHPFLYFTVVFVSTPLNL